MNQSITPKIRLIPPAYLLISILGMIILDWLLPLAIVISYPWTWFGAPLILLGMVPAIYINSVFRKCGTTIKPFHESSALITDGLFRFSRNPIYVGMTILLIGVAIALGSASPWFFVPVFVVIIDVLVIRMEERMLAKTFGEAYAIYQSHVRRWL